MMNQLKRRGRILPNKCHICKIEEKLVDHLLLHCPKASIVWQRGFSPFGVVRIVHSKIRGTLLSWHGSFVGKKSWRVSPLCLF